MTAHAYTAPELERIARTLGGARKNGGGWDCRCPAHDDHEPSLSLSVGKGGKLLWRCHTGCDQAAVLEGLRKRGVLMNGDAREAEPKATKGRIVASYDYVDEHGGLLFQAVRYQPKRFKQRRPDGAGGWVWDLEGVRRVLYRLPELLTAEEVVLVEGEKDADRLRALGFVATTNPQGAGKWRPEYAEFLAGKRVVVLPDNDEAGRKHAGRVAASLRGKAASVKVLALDGLPEKGDASDWLDTGHTADELRRLIAKAEENRPDWRTDLLQGDDGPLACEANVAIALRHAPELASRLRFDELGQAVECTALPWRSCEGWRAWTDNDDTALAIWLQHEGVRVRPATCAAAVELVAADHAHHPVRTYLEGLRWDGTPRLDNWLATYLGAAVEPGREEYARQVGRKSLIQAVARAYQPGVKADHVLILEGVQDIGKSSAIRALVADDRWFADEVADLGSKDAAQDLRGKWLLELAELSAMRRSDVERTKAFITRQVDHYRPSYGRRSQDHPRQCVFFGTTNGDAYLADETGNRRFWPARVGRIDLDALRRDRGQLWAEAVDAYKKGETWWLDAAAKVLATAEQAERRVTDVWEERLLEWAERQAAPFTVGEALTGALNVPVEKQDRAAQMRVSGVLKANGWKRKRLYPPAVPKPTWAYVPDEPPFGGSRGGPETGEVGMRTGEVGMRSRDAAESGEVGINGLETAEVGMVGLPKTQETCGSSQPSQPSQPRGYTRGGEGDGIQTPQTPPPRAHGNRLGGRDGWDAARPDWQDIDAWRIRERAAEGDPECLRRVAAAWAASAGGVASGSAVMLPRLPNCMALAELKALAQGAGLEVRERLQ